MKDETVGPRFYAGRVVLLIDRGLSLESAVLLAMSIDFYHVVEAIADASHVEPSKDSDGYGSRILKSWARDIVGNYNKMKTISSSQWREWSKDNDRKPSKAFWGKLFEMLGIA